MDGARCTTKKKAIIAGDRVRWEAGVSTTSPERTPLRCDFRRY